MPRYITPTLTYDRAAIMGAAWSEARADVRALASAPAPFRGITTARAEFGRALARIWGIARSERDYAIWAAAQRAGASAEAARRAALSDRARRIEDATHRLSMAEQADSFMTANIIAVRAARAQLRLVQGNA